MNFYIFAFAFFLPLCHSQSFDKVITAGYSDKIMTYSFNEGKLTLTQELTLETNMTYIKIEKDLLYAVHEVSQYGSFGKSGAISRWKIGQNEKGLPTFEKLQVCQTCLEILTEGTLVFLCSQFKILRQCQDVR